MTATHDDVTAELERIVADALPKLAPGGGPMPGASPHPGQSRAEWESDVATMRARHDSSAMDAGALMDGILRSALGPDPLGVGEGAVTTEWADVSVPGGSVGLRRYHPETGPESSAPLPVVALIHGGAYWMGGGSAGWQLNDTLCRKLALGVGAIVVSIDHRLAPEHPYPAPLDDVVAALRAIAEHAEQWGADAERIAVFGISSGGNLAAAAAHLGQDGAGPALAAVVLQCPSVNLSIESSRFEADEASVAGARQIIALYVGDADPADPRVSPALREDLTGLPPTLIITADFDPLTADAQLYGDRLADAEVALTRHPYPMTHTVATPAVFRRMHDDTVAWLRGVFG